MARGFKTTLGGTANDIITTGLSTNAILRSFWMWVYPRANVNGMVFWRQQTAGGNVCQTTYNATTYVFHRHWSTALGTWSIASAAAGAWHSLGFSYNGSATANNPIAYLNGAKPGVTRTTGPTGTLLDLSGGPFYIGNDPSLVSCHDGMLAEFAVWDAILDDGEFFAMNKGCSPLMIRPQSLVEYVPLVRNNVSAKLAAPTISGTAVQPHPRIIMPRPQPQQLLRTAVPTFKAAWSMGSNLPVLGTGTY